MGKRVHASTELKLESIAGRIFLDAAIPVPTINTPATLKQAVDLVKNYPKKLDGKKSHIVLRELLKLMNLGGKIDGTFVENSFADGYCFNAASNGTDRVVDVGKFQVLGGNLMFIYDDGGIVTKVAPTTTGSGGRTYDELCALKCEMDAKGVVFTDDDWMDPTELRVSLLVAAYRIMGSFHSGYKAMRKENAKKSEGTRKSKRGQNEAKRRIKRFNVLSMRAIRKTFDIRGEIMDDVARKQQQISKKRKIKKHEKRLRPGWR